MAWYVVKTNSVTNTRISWRDWVLDPKGYRSRTDAEAVAKAWPKDGAPPLVVEGTDLQDVYKRARRGDFYRVS